MVCRGDKAVSCKSLFTELVLNQANRLPDTNGISHVRKDSRIGLLMWHFKNSALFPLKPVRPDVDFGGSKTIPVHVSYPAMFILYNPALTPLNNQYEPAVPRV